MYIEQTAGNRVFERPRHRWGVILKQIFMKWDGERDWIHMVQDRDRY
jgi:hypothetical protein